MPIAFTRNYPHTQEEVKSKPPALFNRRCHQNICNPNIYDSVVTFWSYKFNAPACMYVCMGFYIFHSLHPLFSPTHYFRPFVRLFTQFLMTISSYLLMAFWFVIFIIFYGPSFHEKNTMEAEMRRKYFL